MLIIFIDALPYVKRTHLPNIMDALKLGPLRPGLGYSVNLHAEIFWGQTPDEVGYFGEWAAQPLAGASRNVLLGALEAHALPAVRLWQVFRKKALRRPGDYIPLSFRDAFEKRGVYPLTRPDLRYGVFGVREFSFFVGDSLRARLGTKDEVIWGRVRELGVNLPRDMVVSLCDLDGLYHECGLESEAVLKKYSWLDRVVPELCDRYARVHPGERVFLLSDHGIAAAAESVKIPLKDWLQCCRQGRGLFFLDSLYLSTWGDELRGVVREFFAENEVATLLAPEVRLQYGVQKQTFGEDLWLLNEGRFFNPNFFGFRALHAYHGYDPTLEGSHGVFGTLNGNAVSVPRSTLEVGRMLAKEARH